MSAKPPVKVFGSESKLRAELRRRIQTGEQDLAGHLELAREEFKDAPELDPTAKGFARLAAYLPFSIQLDRVAERIDRWSAGNHRLANKYIGAEAAKEFARSAPPVKWSPDKDDLRPRADDCQRRIDEGLAGLRALLDRLPQGGPVAVRPPEDRFAELRQVGLIEESLLNSYIRRMSKIRTRAQASEAIGAAKELVEACNRATLDRLGVPYPKDDFDKLGKLVRTEIQNREDSAPTTTSRNAIGQMFSGMGTVEHGLGTLRNELGSGHGKAQLPKGLRPRHAQLAIDIAETHVRYLIGTLHDLRLV